MVFHFQFIQVSLKMIYSEKFENIQEVLNLIDALFSLQG